MSDQENNGFPKYQFSVFTKGSRDGQFVIRSNDWTEFKKLKQDIDTIMDIIEERPKTSSQSPTVSDNSPIATINCGIHGTPMTVIPAGISKKTGKAYNSFLVCNELNADGSKCTYKPPKNE